MIKCANEREVGDNNFERFSKDCLIYKARKMHKARQQQTNHPLPAPSAGKCKTGAKRGKSRVSHTGYTCLADHLTPSRSLAG